MTKPPSNAIDTGEPMFDDYYDAAWERHSNLSTFFYEYFEKKQVVGYVTASMSKIHTEIDDNQKQNFPALLLGMLGVDQNYAREGRGTKLVMYIIGLANKLCKQVGCRMVILEVRDIQTDDNTFTEDTTLIKRYKKLGFQVANTNKTNSKMMYFDLKV